MATPLFTAMSTLSADELYVIVSIYWGEVTETQIAAELSELRGVAYTRNQVHRRRLTGEGKLERQLAKFVGRCAA